MSSSLGNPASADPEWDYVDVDFLFELATADNPLSGTFDITAEGIEGNCYLLTCDIGGFDPATQDVEEAQIVFLLFDIEREQYDVAIIELGDSLQMAVADGNDQLFMFVYLENIEANANVLLQLSNTGALDWQIAAADGNRRVRVQSGILSVNATPAAHTPEPTAAILFCVGFSVVGAATRRREMN